MLAGGPASHACRRGSGSTPPCGGAGEEVWGWGAREERDFAEKCVIIVAEKIAAEPQKDERQMSKIFGTILKFMPPWRRWAGPAAVCAAPAAVEIGGELLRGLQEQDALLRPALAAVALAASAAALARRRGDEVGMFPPLLRAADGGKSAASAPRHQGAESLAAAETSPRRGIAKKGALIGGSGKKGGALTGARSGGFAGRIRRHARLMLDYLDHHPEVIAHVEQVLPIRQGGQAGARRMRGGIFL